MEIISKRQAMTIYRQHPESRIFRYCTGKYRQDRKGPYTCLMSITLN